MQLVAASISSVIIITIIIYTSPLHVMDLHKSIEIITGNTIVIVYM